MFSIPFTCYIMITELLFEKDHLINQALCTALNLGRSHLPSHEFLDELLLEAISDSISKCSLDISTILIYMDATALPDLMLLHT